MLIFRKDAELTAQANVSRERLNCEVEADVIEKYRKRLTLADSFETIRNIEANAASFYLERGAEFR
jgi:CRISPR/Cas system-associated endonuclease Cas1